MIVQIEFVSSNIYSPQAKNNPASAKAETGFFMQACLNIFGLNMILATFSDAAVTVLGLYYKWQTFFFIPLGVMQTCIALFNSF